MTIKNQLNESMKDAMRSGDEVRKRTVRMALAAVKQVEVDKRVELDDAAVLSVIDKMLKQRRDSISQYESAGRQDLADAEKFEVGVLSGYMPQALSEAEIQAAVAEAIAASGAAGMQDMGKVMAVLKPKLAGRADMSQVSGLVKAALAK